MDAIPGLTVTPVETNILFVSINADARDFVRKLDQQNVKVLPYGTGRIRLVMHRGIDDDGVSYTAEAFAAVLPI